MSKTLKLLATSYIPLIIAAFTLVYSVEVTAALIFITTLMQGAAVFSIGREKDSKFLCGFGVTAPILGLALLTLAVAHQVITHVATFIIGCYVIWHLLTLLIISEELRNDLLYGAAWVITFGFVLGFVLTSVPVGVVIAKLIAIPIIVIGSILAIIALIKEK